jgi:hypothetical protein
MTCEYLREFSKKFETVLMEYAGAGGKLIHKKNKSKNSRDTVPFKEIITRMGVATMFPPHPLGLPRKSSLKENFVIKLTVKKESS